MRGLKLIPILVISMTLLSGCVTETVTVKCPQLSAPPEEVIKLLEKEKGNRKVEDWTIDLEKHLRKLEKCR